ncbi:MAG: helix-turn-helix domain-containing protein [Crocinitomicaceae bacterium]|nr:helix-turn-helix domain-containing protein [Crocinitomicaceae bacterium]
MEVIVIESSAFDELERRMMKRFENAIQKALENAMKNERKDEIWLTSDDALQVLGYRSRNTLYNLRQNGSIEAKKINGRLRYNYVELLDFLNFE